MKKFVLSVLSVVALAVGAHAQATYTQTVASVSNNLPETAGEFKRQANTALTALSQVDLPAIQSTLNILTTGNVASAKTFNSTVTMTTGITYTATIAPGTTMYTLYASNFPSVVSTAALKYVVFKVGTNHFLFPGWQVLP